MLFEFIKLSDFLLRKHKTRLCDINTVSILFTEFRR